MKGVKLLPLFFMFFRIPVISFKTVRFSEAIFKKAESHYDILNIFEIIEGNVRRKDDNGET
jgi:hypothetical protein